MRWYHQVSSAPEGDFSALANALMWFEKERDDAAKFFKYDGIKLEDAHKRLPGLMMYYYDQTQELEAILEWLEVLLTKAMGKARRFYTESYARSLSERQVEKWAEGDPAVIDIRMLIVEVSHARNRHLGVSKGLDAANFQLGHINHLRRAGIEDTTL